MPKLETTKAQRLLSLMETKITELQDEIAQIETKKICPFWHDFFDDENDDDCPYINGSNLCESLEVCPSNSDAWCYKKIKAGIKKEKESEIIEDIKTVLRKYADLRCDSCDITET